MSPTRFPKGVTNSNPRGPLASMGQLDPTKYVTLFEDYVATGTVAGLGGYATLATTVAKATPFTSFLGNGTKGMWATANASLATVAANTMTLGFADSLSAPTKGMYVTLTAGTTLTLYLKGTATTSVAVPVVYANAQQVTFGLSYSANRNILCGYFNGVRVCSITDMTNFDSVTPLLGGFVPTGATATVDYVFVAQER